MADVMILEANEETFDFRVLDAEVPVLVVFWARWCESCARLEPVLEQLAEEVRGRALIVKVDADENRELLFRLKVRELPALKIFRNGVQTAHFLGSRPKEKLLRLLIGE